MGEVAGMKVDQNNRKMASLYKIQGNKFYPIFCRLLEKKNGERSTGQTVGNLNKLREIEVIRVWLGLR